MEIKTDLSVVVIDGKWFPAAHVICPSARHRGDPLWNEDTYIHDGILTGFGGGTPVVPHVSFTVGIPCENGSIVGIQTEDGGLYTVHLWSPNCQWVDDPNDTVGSWIPDHIDLFKGALYACGSHRLPQKERTFGYWSGAEEDWVAEHVLRLSAMPFINAYTDTPMVRLLPLDSVSDPAGRSLDADS